jgi:hypothetical protein
MGQYLSAPITEKVGTPRHDMHGNRTAMGCSALHLRRLPLTHTWDLQTHVQEVLEGHNERLAFGLAAMQGWRVAMVSVARSHTTRFGFPGIHSHLNPLAALQEDDHVSAINFHDNISVFSVFDGHGGKVVAKFCAKHLVSS